MWYGGWDGVSAYYILYATSSDGLTWTKYDNTVPSASDTTSTNGRIPLGTAGKGDDAQVFQASVILDGSTYKMWYSAYDGTNYRIYYATSPDGLTWTKYDNTIPTNSDTSSTNGRIPLGTNGTGDDTNVYGVSVIKDGSTYKMWYGGHDGSTQRIYYATSPDGLTWTKYDNTVPSNSDTSSTNGRIPLGTNTTGDDTQAVPPGILIDGTTYKIWYGGSDGSNGRTYYATMTATTNSVPPASDPTRNVNFFEDEDESSSNNFTRIFTTGTANGYAEATISSADLSTYDYVTAWVFSSKAGNEIKLGIGESAATEQTETVYVDSANVWQKVYWDITDIPYDQRDAITKLRITVTEVGTNTYIDNITADRYLTNSAGSTISSTPDEYIQYRAILTTTNSAYRPKLYDAKIEWGNGFKIQQTDANTVRLYNYTGETQQLRLDAVVFGADLAEYYTVNDQSIGAGDVVAMTGQLDEYGVPILRKTNRINDPDIAGVISTLAGQTLGLEAEDRRLLGLAGRVPVKVASDSPAISAGDLLTSSDEEGKARRARPGDKTIGKALENWGPDSGKDQVLMLIGNSIALPSFGDISDLVVEKVEDLGKTTYQLVDAAGEKLENVAAYSQAVIANLTAGSIEAEKISSPIIETVDIVATGTAQLNKIETNEIKPVEKDLVINLDREFSIDSNDNSSSTSGELAKIIIKGLEGKTVTTIDDAGNASFSGQVVAQSLSIRDDATVSGTLYANELKTNEASISGKLTAKEIEADNLTDLANRLAVTANDSSALASNVNEIQTLLADIQNNPVPDPDNYQNIDDELFSINSNDITTQELTVVGNSNLYNVSVSGSIIAGTTLIENNSITSLASELKFSALSKINFFDGAVTVARDGTITTRGELIAEGGIKTAEIKPINDTVTLAGNLDVKGDLILNKYLEATDSASIIAAADNFEVNGIFSPAIETATSSAGVALMPANSSEVIIYNNTIKRDSLVYLTPTSEAPLNNQLTVSEKQDCIGSSTCKKYFKVVINIPPTTPTKFNWLIVN